jgi:hypothetical protein
MTKNPPLLEKQFRRPEGVLLQELPDGEAVILHVDTGTYLGLNSVGFDIWNTINASESVQAAFESLLARYEVDAVQLLNDVETLVQEMLANGLLEEVSA